MAQINYCVSNGWMPDGWVYGMPNKLIELGLPIAIKRPWLDDIDKDCELIIAMGYPPTSCFFTAWEGKENKTWVVGDRKIVAHVWDIYKHKFELDNWYGGKFMNQFNFFKTCSGVITFSQETVDILAEYGIEAEEQLSYFDDITVDSAPEEEKKDQIITCTRFSAEKNHLVAIMAQTLLPCRWNYLMTTPPGPQYIGELALGMAKEWGIPTEIKADLPYMEVLKEIKQSRLMITVPMHEGFGVTVKEAIWGGTPVIASDIPPFREHHGDTIPLVNPYDPIPIARAIDNIWINGFDLTAAKKKIEPLTIHNQAVKFIDYLTRKKLI